MPDDATRHRAEGPQATVTLEVYDAALALDILEGLPQTETVAPVVRRLKAALLLIDGSGGGS